MGTTPEIDAELSLRLREFLARRRAARVAASSNLVKDGDPARSMLPHGDDDTYWPQDVAGSWVSYGDAPYRDSASLPTAEIASSSSKRVADGA